MGLCLIEKFFLHMKGRKDGKAGFPKNEEINGWTAPKLLEERELYSKKETKIYKCCTRKVGKLSNKAEKLANKIKNDEIKLNNWKTQITNAIQNANMPEIKLGEDQLDIEIVKKRRMREIEPFLQETYEKCEKMQKKLDRNKSKLEKLMNKIVAIEDLSIIKSEKVRSHYQIRLAVYWGAAIKYLLHKDNSLSCPSYPPNIVLTSGEATYFSLYKERTEKRINTMMARNSILDFKLKEQSNIAREG